MVYVNVTNRKTRYYKNFLNLIVSCLGTIRFISINLGVAGVLGFSWASLYCWYKTAKFTGKKFYWHVLMGERQWDFEYDRNNSSN